MEPIRQLVLLAGPVALVTGGGTGIELETATQLARLGAHVATVGRVSPAGRYMDDTALVVDRGRQFCFGQAQGRTHHGH